MERAWVERLNEIMLDGIILDTDGEKARNWIFRDRKELFSRGEQLACRDVLYNSDYFGPIGGAVPNNAV